MARTADKIESRPDVYVALAKPGRRAILELLAEAERAVNDLAAQLGADQPSVSKSLRVLREAHLVNVRRDGKRRVYSIRPEALQSVQAWVARFERLWDHQLDRIQARAEARRR